MFEYSKTNKYETITYFFQQSFWIRFIHTVQWHERRGIIVKGQITEILIIRGLETFRWPRYKSWARVPECITRNTFTFRCIYIICLIARVKKILTPNRTYLTSNDSQFKCSPAFLVLILNDIHHKYLENVRLNFCNNVETFNDSNASLLVALSLGK